MSNPQMSFRLTHYQLARGLKIIRTIEPNHQLTSLSQLAKTIYIDYISKNSLLKDDIITDADLAEIANLAYTKAEPMTLNAFQAATRASALAKQVASDLTKASKPEVSELEAEQEALPEEKSEISSVSDFSPPTDWLE